MPEAACQVRLPIVWCPRPSPERQENQQQQEQQQEEQEEKGKRQLEQRYDEEQETPGNRPKSRRVDVRERVTNSVDDNNNDTAAAGGAGGNVGDSGLTKATSPAGRRRRGVGASGGASVSRAALTAAGDQADPDGALRFAWIPADPCSCVDAPGLVGEACRGWLRARARWSEPFAQLEVRVW